MDGVEIVGPVEGLDDAEICGPCVLGVAGADFDDQPLVLGAGVVIRAFAVLYRGSRLGPRVHVGHNALIREGNEIGAEVSIGSGAHLEPGNRIGDRSRIHSGCFLSHCVFGEDVFCGPNVTFTDDPHPPCPNYLDCVRGGVVGAGAAIGGGAVILPGVHIGAGSLVGAGATVTHDVSDGAIAVGNPARARGWRRDLRCDAGTFEPAYAWADS
jgi:acetyltransferase-like isoleucine patch superfamily enzyme